MKNESSTKPLRNILVKHVCTKFVRFGSIFVRSHFFKMSVSPQTSQICTHVCTQFLYAFLYAVIFVIFQKFQKMSVDF